VPIACVGRDVSTKVICASPTAYGPGADSVSTSSVVLVLEPPSPASTDASLTPASPFGVHFVMFGGHERSHLPATQSSPVPHTVPHPPQLVPTVPAVPGRAATIRTSTRATSCGSPCGSPPV